MRSEPVIDVNRDSLAAADDDRLRPAAQILVQAVLDVRGDFTTAQTRVPLQTLGEACGMHRMGPALYRRIVAAGNAPADWAPALAPYRTRQLFGHVRASADLAPIAAEFDARGIRWVVAKGPVAADLIWPSPDMRQYADIDLFVHPADFAQALATLEELGCSAVDRNWPEIRNLMRAEVALAGPAGTPIDLHWDMAVPPELRRAFSIDMAGMLERRRRAVLGSGVSVWVFDPVDTVLHLAFHAAQAGGARLMWLGDLYYAVRADGFDARELEARARRARAEVPVAVVLGRVDRVLGLPPECSAMIAGYLRRPAARMVRWRDSRAPLPALAGDRKLAGDLVSGVRRGTAASALGMLGFVAESRRITRRVRTHGPDDEPLDQDVPDASAREEYLSLVVASAR